MFYTERVDVHCTLSYTSNFLQMSIQKIKNINKKGNSKKKKQLYTLDVCYIN